MSIFQISGLALVGVFLAVSARSWMRGSRLLSPALGWSLLWCAAGVAIAWPGVTQAAAKLLGIGRGADLVLYCAVLGTCAGFFALYRRNRALDRDITQLVRHLALSERDQLDRLDAQNPHNRQGRQDPAAG